MKTFRMYAVDRRGRKVSDHYTVKAESITEARRMIIDASPHIDWSSCVVVADI